jgi:hypothetical protein
VFYDVNTNTNNRRLSACQIVIQILTWLAMLLLMFDTYPYEVGLIGVLFKSNTVFKLLLVVAPLYLVVSLISIGYRVRARFALGVSGPKRTMYYCLTDWLPCLRSRARAR